jgi:hypothetical protein
VGGPFFPDTLVMTLTNAGETPLNWTLGNTSAWLSVSLAGGTLLPDGPSITVTARLNAVATILPMGIYSDTLWFTNLTSGVANGRSFVLRVGQPDFFTEVFAGDFDLTFSSLTLTPNGSADFYAACRNVATNFPIDPAGGIPLFLSDDSFISIALFRFTTARRISSTLAATVT